MDNNIFKDVPEDLPEELVQTLLDNKNIRIERIVSKGHQSKEDFWYDQAENEWVILITGNAVLEFETGKVTLKAGDYLNIPAHKKHRVAWTDPDVESIWLAIFY